MTLTVTPQESTESTSTATLNLNTTNLNTTNLNTTADIPTRMSDAPEIVAVKSKAKPENDDRVDADFQDDASTVVEAEFSAELGAESEVSPEVEAEPELTFEHFGLKESILRGIKEAGFTSPSPIQQQALPIVLSGRDVIARAQTGTGKTAAFGLPSMNAITGRGGVEVLVIVPTRELASQVSDELYRLGRYANFRTVAVYGGQSISRQVDLIRRGAQIVTATPGRLLDHLKSGRLDNFNPSMVILDEADEMLDMGFLDDIDEIFNYLPDSRQTLLFSATLPQAIRDLSQKILKQPVTIDVTPKGTTTNDDITQRYYVIEEREREGALVRLIDTEAPNKALIFCRTKKETDMLCTTLVSRGYAASSLHGDMQQRQRNEAIENFKRGRIDLLIATDVAARGLDINDVSHVFNYHIPFDSDSYVHRIGRTGRAGRKGTAVTLVTPLEFKKLTRIMHTSGAPIVYQEVPSIGDAKKLYHNELITKLERQQIKEEAAELLQRIEEDIDVSQIACKALSMLLEDRSVDGPSKIGFSLEEVEHMMRRAKRTRGAGGAGAGGGYRRRGGSGGGGGYRRSAGGGAPRTQYAPPRRRSDRDRDRNSSNR
jgi:ATP-dependent RNA helicase DeaD